MEQTQDVFKKTRFVNEQHKALVALYYLGTLTEKHVQKTLSPFDISVNDSRILLGLDRVHPEAVSVYKLKMFLAEQNVDVSRAVARLEKKSLVKRKSSKEKGTQKNIVLTEKGKDLANKINERQLEFIKPMDGISEEEAIYLNKVFDRLMDKFRNLEIG